MTAFLWFLLIVVVLAIVIVVLARFYERATREVSLVKTGVGGRRIVMDGGVIAVPYFHQISRVNMQSLRLEVQRSGESSLITKDRLRVDVGAEFYVSVIATEDGIARAAQTLGSRTFDAAKLRELIEGKLVDALRAVAARFTMDELHENRGRFVAEVRESLLESLARNGLELDTVSLTALDQTTFKALDENNAFNAVGMRKLAEVIAKSKKERAEIDADAEVSVRKAAMEATRRKLQIELDEQAAQIAQVQQIETLKAAQLAEVVQRKAESELASTRARIEMEQRIRTADLERERLIREAEIAQAKALAEAEIARERDLALAEQQRQIAIAQQSQAESQARAAADAARAESMRAAEAVPTAKALAEAERRKAVAVLAAQQEAEVAGTRARLAAATEVATAQDRASAKLKAAQAEAEAVALRAQATKQELLAQAEGRRALAEAENALDERASAMRVELAKVEALPKVLAEMVKPAEKIDSIRIHQVTGLGGAVGGEGASADTRPPVNQALDSVMAMAVQLPALKKLGEDLGMSLDAGLAGVTKPLDKR
ncbi:flotillin family protein [Rubrivivax albus]|uniref:Flotillin n=1 Tax=Rubrivivax albus TaxID=2499835 RepID=A0A437JXD9_9BURK|nr:flotillin domain-containing protein [Rubrivivax albus]RVT52353.1 flotillin [Rubrivivax albus]